MSAGRLTERCLVVKQASVPIKANKSPEFVKTMPMWWGLFDYLQRQLRARRELALFFEQSGRCFGNGTASPARTGDLLIHNQAL